MRKTLEYYMALPYTVEIVPDEESGYVATYPDLPGCFSAGETLGEAALNAEDAKREWLQSALEEGSEIKEPGHLSDYSGQFKLRIPRSLHSALARHSKDEGISMNQYCLYLLSRNDALYTAKTVAATAA